MTVPDDLRQHSAQSQQDVLALQPAAADLAALVPAPVEPLVGAVSFAPQAPGGKNLIIIIFILAIHNFY